MIDLRYVKKLIEMIDESTVDSIEISSDKGMKIRISKTPQQRGADAGGDAGADAGRSCRPRRSRRITPAAGNSGHHRRRRAGRGRAAEAGAARGQVADGRHVLQVAGAGRQAVRRRWATASRRGRSLCIIEAMKIMNEIESEYAGVVREVLVQDAQPVEYGQVLFRIDPNG